jgi:hypothetical protein
MFYFVDVPTAGAVRHDNAKTRRASSCWNDRGGSDAGVGADGARKDELMIRPRRMIMIIDGNAAHMTVAGGKLTLDIGGMADQISSTFLRILGIELLPWEARRGAIAIEIMRATRPWQEARYPGERLKPIENAIDILTCELPALVDFLRDASQEPLPAYLDDALERRIGIFEGLRVAALHALELTGSQPPRVREAIWHGDAIWLAGFANMVGRRVGQVPKLTSAGDGVQFMIGALALAGITVSKDQVIKLFRRRTKPIPSAAYVEGQS